jgi:hypothetical protein
MAAFNYILCETKCPGCHQTIEVQFQTHMASDAIEEDEFGRLNGRVYRLGEKMAWFAKEGEDYEDWMTYGKPVEGLLPYEFCWGTCPSCGVEFYVRIEFEDLRPIRITEIDLATHWPSDPDMPLDRYPEVFLADFPMLKSLNSTRIIEPTIGKAK